MGRTDDVRKELGGFRLRDDIRVRADSVVHLVRNVLIDKRIVWGLVDTFEDVDEDIRFVLGGRNSTAVED